MGKLRLEDPLSQTYVAYQSARRKLRMSFLELEATEGGGR